jgi:hypothetical protein
MSELASSDPHVVVGALDTQHVLYTRHELCIVERLRNLVVRIGSKTLRPPATIVRSSQQDDRQESALGDGLHHSARIDSAEPWHSHVENQQVDGARANRVDSLLAAVDRHDVQAAGPKQSGDVLTRGSIVVGNDYKRR